MGLSTVTVTTVVWLCHMTGALGNDARSDQDIVIATLRLNYGRVRAIPNPCAIYTIMYQSFETLACLGFACSNFAKKNKRLLAVYARDVSPP